MRRILGAYFERYHCCPTPWPVQGPEFGRVVEVAEAGGMYHHYERRAA